MLVFLFIEIRDKHQLDVAKAPVCLLYVIGLSLCNSQIIWMRCAVDWRGDGVRARRLIAMLRRPVYLHCAR
jgi:hypothetical protein